MPALVDQSRQGALFEAAKKHVEGHKVFTNRIKAINEKFSTGNDATIKTLLGYAKPVIKHAIQSCILMRGNVQNVQDRAQVTLQMLHRDTPVPAIQDSPTITKQQATQLVNEGQEDGEDVW